MPHRATVSVASFGVRPRGSSGGPRACAQAALARIEVEMPADLEAGWSSPRDDDRRHVDLLRGTVEVVEIVTEVGGVIHVGPPKTRASRRRVVLPRQVVAALDAHLREFTGPSADAWVFAGPDGGVLRRTHFRSRAWTRATAARAAGVRVHDLRHTAISLWIDAGANVKDVSVRAGHTSAAFTLDRYGHRYSSADEALARRLDDVFVGPARDGQTCGRSRPPDGLAAARS